MSCIARMFVEQRQKQPKEVNFYRPESRSRMHHEEMVACENNYNKRSFARIPNEIIEKILAFMEQNSTFTNAFINLLENYGRLAGDLPVNHAVIDFALSFFNESLFHELKMSIKIKDFITKLNVELNSHGHDKNQFDAEGKDLFYRTMLRGSELYPDCSKFSAHLGRSYIISNVFNVLLRDDLQLDVPSKDSILLAEVKGFHSIAVKLQAAKTDAVEKHNSALQTEVADLRQEMTQLKQMLKQVLTANRAHVAVTAVDAKPASPPRPGFFGAK